VAYIELGMKKGGHHRHDSSATVQRMAVAPGWSYDGMILAAALIFVLLMA
jgi:hypothetical protein